MRAKLTKEENNTAETNNAFVGISSINEKDYQPVINSAASKAERLSKAAQEFPEAANLLSYRRTGYGIY